MGYTVAAAPWMRKLSSFGCEPADCRSAPLGVARQAPLRLAGLPPPQHFRSGSKSAPRLKGGDALLKGRVTHEQPLQAAAFTAGNAEGRQLLR